MKRLATFIASLAVSVLGYSLLTTTSASAANLTWTGQGQNSGTSVPENWSPSQAPSSGDTLIFPGGKSEEKVLFNSGVTVDTVHFGGTGSGDYEYIVSGTLLTRNIISSAPNNASGVVDMDAAVSISNYGGSPTTTPVIYAHHEGSIISFNGNLVLGVNSITNIDIVGPGSVSVTSNNVSGTASTISLKERVGISLYGNDSEIPNTHLLVGEGSDVWFGNLAWLGSSLTRVSGESSVNFLPGATIQSKIALTQDSVLRADLLSIDASANIVFAPQSELVLEGEAFYESYDRSVNLVIKGNICVSVEQCGVSGNANNSKITPIAGSLGKVIVDLADGKKNYSKTPNGETKPEAKVEIITDKQDTEEYIYANHIIVLKGSRKGIVVEDGGTLKGTGNAGILVIESGGRLAPGESPGILNAGNTAFEEGSFFEVEIAGNVVGQQYDQLKVAGTVNLGNATLETKFLNNFIPKAGDAFTIIDNDGGDAVSGTFKDLPEGATFTIDGVLFKITYKGGDGNDVVLTVAEVPGTPNTGFALLSSSPMMTLLATLGSSAMIVMIARKYGAIKN